MAPDEAVEAKVERFRRAIAENPGDLALIMKFSLLCPGHDAVVAALNDAWASGHFSVADRIHVARLRMAMVEDRARRARASPINAASPDELGFHHATAEAQDFLEATTTFLRQKPHSLGGLKLHAQALLATGGPAAAEPALARLRGTDLSIDRATNFDPAFHATLEKAYEDAKVSRLPYVTEIHSDSAANIVFAACDGGYFRSFGTMLVRSFARQAAPDIGLALHLFDVQPDDAHALAAELAQEPGLRFSLSCEWTGLAGSEAARGYYHAVRFIRYCMYLEQLPARSGWALDADMIFRRAPEMLFNHLRGHDTGLWLMPARPDFANQFAAGMVGIASTPAGRGYIRRVAGYIARCMENGPLPWGVDQVALYAAYIGLAAEGRAPAIATVSPDIYDGAFAPDRILWPGKCTREDPGFPAFAAFAATMEPH